MVTGGEAMPTEVPPQVLDTTRKKRYLSTHNTYTVLRSGVLLY